jgi:hypothetical protein
MQWARRRRYAETAMAAFWEAMSRLNRSSHVSDLLAIRGTGVVGARTGRVASTAAGLTN